MVYADGSNPSVRKDIGVRLPSPALSFLPREGLGSAPRNAVVKSVGSTDFGVARVSILGFAARCREPHAPSDRAGEGRRGPRSFGRLTKAPKRRGIRRLFNL